jgi:hypothetical protein
MFMLRHIVSPTQHFTAATGKELFHEYLEYPSTNQWSDPKKRSLFLARKQCSIFYYPKLSEY